MLVDDHALVRAAVRQALTAPDVEIVAEAATAEETLTLAPQVRPDVLLVDVDLPGMDGLRLVRELAPRLPGTRIVMLTVSKSDRDVAEAVRNGAAGFLVKDLSPEALLRSVRSAARGELVMPRAMADLLIRALVESAGRGREANRDQSPDGLTTREAEVLRLLAQGPDRSGHRGRAEHLDSDGRDAREQRAAQDEGSQPCGGDPALPRSGLRSGSVRGAGIPAKGAPGGRDLDAQEARLGGLDGQCVPVAHEEQQAIGREHRVGHLAEGIDDDHAAGEHQPPRGQVQVTGQPAPVREVSRLAPIHARVPPDRAHRLTSVPLPRDG